MKEGFFNSKAFIFGLLIVFILISIALGREAYRNYKIGQEIKALQGKIDELNKNNTELAEMERYLNSQEFLEKEARLKLNLIREGEKLVIVKQSDTVVTEEESQELNQSEGSNIEKWWKYLFNK